MLCFNLHFHDYLKQNKLLLLALFRIRQGLEGPLKVWINFNKPQKLACGNVSLPFYSIEKEPRD